MKTQSISMFIGIVTLLCTFPKSIYAYTVPVHLDAPEILRVHHSGHVSMGITYTDSSITSWNLFKREELKDNIYSKTIELEDDKTIESCIFHWSIMQSPPVPATEETIYLMHDSSFDGVYKGKCNIDPNSGIITLKTDFKMEALTLRISKETLNRHKSFFLIGKLKINEIDKGFNFDQISKTEDVSKRIHILYKKEKLEGNLLLSWYLDDSTILEEKIVLTTPLMEIK